MLQVHKFEELPDKCEEYKVAPEKLISGNPTQRVWMHYTDSSEQFFAGVWFSEVGKWTISYTEEEYCELLEGQSVISDDAGDAVTVEKGDCFVIPRGFTGTWEVRIPTRKKFVIYEPAIDKRE